MFTTRFLTTAAAALAISVAAMPASAQSSGTFKTKADIIRDLQAGIAGPTRGIRPASGAASGAASAAVTPSSGGSAPRVAAQPAMAESNLDVLFLSGSAELTPQAMRQLNELGQALRDVLKDAKFRIEGHTDTTGAPDANLDLSRRRAEAVVAYLEGNFSIPPARLEAVGKGQTELAVPTGAGVPEPRNRRVRVVNLGS